MLTCVRSMSIHVALHHLTSYRYERPVALGPHTVRLRPAPHCRTRILGYSQKVRPSKHFINWQQDPQANYIARLVFPDKMTELEIEIDVIAEMVAQNPFDFFLEPYAEKWPFEYDPSLSDELAPYRKVLPGARVDAFVEREVTRREQPTNDFLVGLNQKVCNHIEYRVRLESGLQSPDETLEKRSGSCRDSGWLLVQMLRRLGFAARFVSGYLIQLTSDVKPLTGPAGPSSDFVDLHAWCEVYLPGAGWIGLDPTSGLLAGEGHLPLACTAEPMMAAPVSGLVDRCETVFEHSMQVTRILEVPRVTKPYTEDTWQAIQALGHAIDQELQQADVRLTMGGEPTFVAVDDLEAEEWNTAALGPSKRRLATDLYRRLKARHAPNGLSHFGQGKWYPGEPLPRWALNLYWRRDGEPVWTHPELIADEEKPSGADAALAKRFLEAFAGHMGLDASFVFAAHEDVYYYLWRERRMPINVDPLDSKLDDPLERKRLTRLFGTGLDKPVGWVFPIQKTKEKTREWRTGPWHFRAEHCYLVPGDSPLGLRLPLDTKPWVAPEDRELPETSDLLESLLPLPTRSALEKKPKSAPSETREPKPGESAPWVTRTALCAEPRNGTLYVFLPPVDRLDDYLELVTAIEKSAASVGAPVMLEGYTPPRDPRLIQLSVTPDPGVIEVNIHPSASWTELSENTTKLYEDARLSGLSAEKFAVDGRHTGTGGGNHVVLGGATPDDSPFLRRPELLASLVAYFHQHPALSYLFSGQFIGPTSQAPRIDEARNDSVFELEIAFEELARRLADAKKAGHTPPWLVDRLFRDLLVDVTGNTHRAEFCIDKLYSPDGTTGRLGLLELRALEMPPHSRMSLTQQLLLRALIARFWKAPYAPDRLARWGTELHDRFMLPHFVWQDFESVLEEMATAGYALKSEWFAPHFEFRFPKYGDFVAEGVDVELRSALEPWHVMGEDVAAGGTARYVDSSLERIQVKARGMAPDRFLITVNGKSLPLRPTGTTGEWVAGVRFRAWQPPRCLHPHIKVHAPLVFDLHDRWTGRSVGGCEYHVAHPGGRAHDTRPINALEAEGRRRARFFRMGHTPAESHPAPPKPSPDFPFTLDLRRS
jgi:uncharacterized protein (DUF2126 family)/transglutaminase-like putative cysteine protease